MNLNVKAVVHLNGLSVPAIINNSRLMTSAVANAIGTFPTPSPDITTVNAAIDALEQAWNNAADGGKTKTALMHDSKTGLLKLMNDLAHYVEAIANGDEGIIHLAAMAVKKPSLHTMPVFEVTHNGDKGSVQVKIKAVRGAVYTYQYSTEPVSDNSWVIADEGTKSKSVITGLKPGLTYWFRVSIIDKEGRHPFNNPISIIVI